MKSVRWPAALLASALVATAASAGARWLSERPASTAQARAGDHWRGIRERAGQHSRHALLAEARRDRRFSRPHDEHLLRVAVLWLSGVVPPGPIPRALLATLLWDLNDPLAHARAVGLLDGADCDVMAVLLKRPSPFMAVDGITNDQDIAAGAFHIEPCRLGAPFAARLRPLLPEGAPAFLAASSLHVIASIAWGRPDELEAVRRYVVTTERTHEFSTHDDYASLKRVGLERDAILVLVSDRIVALALLDDRVLMEHIAAASGARAFLSTPACRALRCDARFPSEHAVVTAAEVLLGRARRESLHAVLREDWRIISSPRPQPRVPMPL